MHWKGFLTRLVALVAMVAALAACGGNGDTSAQSVTTAKATREAPARLAGVKDYLVDHTQRLTEFTGRFQADARRYYRLADASELDYQTLWGRRRSEVAPLVERLKRSWIQGNPYYERVEGVVAGTPSLAEFDVILDAGSSAAEDPQSAVPFDLTLPDGTVLEQPGNLFNLTEGTLWGTLPAGLPPSTPVDLDGDGREEFGEVLPDARLLTAAAAQFDRSAMELDRAARAWRPTDTDAFTALVVMVPTMSEYFGQWKESRFVAGQGFDSESFNVVSRLSDINDILTGLDVIFAGVEARIAKVDSAQARQTDRELADLKSFIDDLHRRERAGESFAPEQADLLGAEAQERGTAIAGQISQAAAALGVEIAQ
jgi:hypothetical protein